MILPECGRVLIIDDKLDEVEGLIQLLACKNVPLSYFNGNDMFPDKPVKGIRIVFLDMKLRELLNDPDGKQSASILMGILPKIIDKNNGPYVIVAWTKHTEHLNVFEEALKGNSDLPKPYVLIGMEKDDCKDPGGNYNIALIKAKLTEKLGVRKDIIRLFILWENILHHSAGDIIESISSLVYHESADQWKDNLENLFYNLAVANAGENNITDDTVIRESFITLNSVYKDQIEKNVVQKFDDIVLTELSQAITLQKKKVIEEPSYKNDSQLSSDANKQARNKLLSDHYKKIIEPKSKLNAALLIQKSIIENTVFPGNVYKYEDIYDRKGLNKYLRKIKAKINVGAISRLMFFRQIFKETHIEGVLKKLFVTPSDYDVYGKELIPIVLNFTAPCDFANGNDRYERLILGCILPSRLIKAHAKEKQGKVISNAEYLCISPNIYFNNEPMNILVNKKYLFGLEAKELESIRPIFRLRNELMADIQQKISSHISRTGVTSI